MFNCFLKSTPHAVLRLWPQDIFCSKHTVKLMMVFYRLIVYSAPLFLMKTLRIQRVKKGNVPTFPFSNVDESSPG